jgi:hypothetical protein
MRSKSIAGMIVLFAALSANAAQITASGGIGRVVGVRMDTNEYGKFYVSLKNSDTPAAVEFYVDYSSSLTPRYLTVALTALGDRSPVEISAYEGSVEVLEAKCFSSSVCLLPFNFTP